MRAFNVLRQYDVSEVLAAWRMMIAGLSPGGQIIEGTCDEIGRRAAWVLLDESGPRTLTLAWDPPDVDKPSDVAERLPKALIHENTEGHKVFALLQAADAAWDRAAGYAPYGPRVRWRFAREDLLGQPGRGGKAQPASANAGQSAHCPLGTRATSGSEPFGGASASVVPLQWGLRWIVRNCHRSAVL